MVLFGLFGFGAMAGNLISSREVFRTVAWFRMTDFLGSRTRISAYVRRDQEAAALVGTLGERLLLLGWQHVERHGLAAGAHGVLEPVRIGLTVQRVERRPALAVVARRSDVV